MQDPFTWSLPVGRFFGIRVRVHFLLGFFLAYQLLDSYLKAGSEYLRFTLVWESILFVSILLHEFGHCFAARAVGGSAEEILMWPLGGLAFVNVPHTPRDQFITTVWGPLVNVVLCVATGSVILAGGYLPPWNPLAKDVLYLHTAPWSSLDPANAPDWLHYVAVAFAVNWILLLFNLIPAFPMDSGRMLRCLLWWRLGFGHATRITVNVAKICALVLGVIGLLTFQGPQGLLLVAIAVFIYVMSTMELRMVAESLLFDESVFGYDFSQGYTSLAKSESKARARRPGLWVRWWRGRAKARKQRELAKQQEQDRRVDEILAKLHREGMASLSDQERRFLTRVSAKYRSRNRSDD